MAKRDKKKGKFVDIEQDVSTEYNIPSESVHMKSDSKDDKPRTPHT